MCDEVVVECAPLGYGRAGPEEGFIEKYAQSFGDAERTAVVFHGRAKRAERDGSSVSNMHSNKAQSRNKQREGQAVDRG